MYVVKVVWFLQTAHNTPALNVLLGRVTAYDTNALICISVSLGQSADEIHAPPPPPHWHSRKLVVCYVYNTKNVPGAFATLHVYTALYCITPSGSVSKIVCMPSQQEVGVSSVGADKGYRRWKTFPRASPKKCRLISPPPPPLLVAKKSSREDRLRGRSDESTLRLTLLVGIIFCLRWDAWANGKAQRVFNLPSPAAATAAADSTAWQTSSRPSRNSPVSRATISTKATTARP